MESNFVVYWGLNLQNTYNYGSIVKFKQHAVYFSNRQISPGFKFHSWKSLSSFERNSSWATLPLVKSGVEYSVTLNADIEPAESVHTQIEFFDESNELIDEQIFAQQQFQFIVPDRTKSYQVSLLSLNNEHINFKNLQIVPPESDFDMVVKDNRTKVVQVKAKTKAVSKVKIFIKDRFLETGSYIGDSEQELIYMEYNGRQRVTIKQIVDDSWQLIKDLVDWKSFDVNFSVEGTQSELALAIKNQLSEKILEKGEQ